MRLLVLSLVTALIAPAIPAEKDEAFTVGVLRRDGTVIPFAAFDGKAWTTPWPRDFRWLEVPISLETVPEQWFGKVGKPSEVTVWADGVKGTTISLRSPVLARVACSWRLGLRTSYRAPETLPPPLEQPYPKDGLVVAGAAVIDPIAIVERNSAEWSAVSQSLLEPFAVTEQAAVNRIPGWKHPINADLRRRIPIIVETMYRAPMDEEGWTANFVEVVKRYPPGPDDGGCGLVTSISGFVLSGPHYKREFRLDAVVSYCDRRDVAYFLPFGRVTANGRIYWLYQQAGYGEEHYIVVRPTPTKVEGAAGYAAAMCRR